MRALVPFTENRLSVPAIPPCDFDAAFSRAVASPDVAPGFYSGTATRPRFRFFPRRHFARLTNDLAELRCPPIHILLYLWRCYVAACVCVATILLVICLGIFITDMTGSVPVSPTSSQACPATNSPSHTPNTLTVSSKF